MGTQDTMKQVDALLAYFASHFEGKSTGEPMKSFFREQMKSFFDRNPFDVTYLVDSILRKIKKEHFSSAIQYGKLCEALIEINQFESILLKACHGELFKDFEKRIRIKQLSSGKSSVTKKTNNSLRISRFVNFLGILFLQEICPYKYICRYIYILLSIRDDFSLNCLCLLLLRCGKKLDEQLNAKNLKAMDHYIKSINILLDNHEKFNIRGRTVFVLYQMITLRELGWPDRGSCQPRSNIVIVDEVSKLEANPLSEQSDSGSTVSKMIVEDVPFYFTSLFTSPTEFKNVLQTFVLEDFARKNDLSGGVAAFKERVSQRNGVLAMFMNDAINKSELIDFCGTLIIELVQKELISMQNILCAIFVITNGFDNPRISYIPFYNNLAKTLQPLFSRTWDSLPISFIEFLTTAAQTLLAKQCDALELAFSKLSIKEPLYRTICEALRDDSKVVDRVVFTPIRDTSILRLFIALICQKSVSAPEYCSKFARICSSFETIRAFDTRTHTFCIFKVVLLEFCFNQFTRNRLFELVLERYRSNVEACADPALNEKLKRRYNRVKNEVKERLINNCIFILELYKENLLNFDVLGKYVEHLFDFVKDASLQCACLCKLLDMGGVNCTPMANMNPIIVKPILDRINNLINNKKNYLEMVAPLDFIKLKSLLEFVEYYYNLTLKKATPDETSKEDERKSEQDPETQCQKTLGEGSNSNVPKLSENVSEPNTSNRSTDEKSCSQVSVASVSQPIATCSSARQQSKFIDTVDPQFARGIRREESSSSAAATKLKLFSITEDSSVHDTNYSAPATFAIDVKDDKFTRPSKTGLAKFTKDNLAEPTHREEGVQELIEMEKAGQEPAAKEEASQKPIEKEEAVKEPAEREEAVEKPAEREEDQLSAGREEAVQELAKEEDAVTKIIARDYNSESVEKILHVISTNVDTIEDLEELVCKLTQYVCEYFYLLYQTENDVQRAGQLATLFSDKFSNMLKFYLTAKPDFEMICLETIVNFVRNKAYQCSFLLFMCHSLLRTETVSRESFRSWYEKCGEDESHIVPMSLKYLFESLLDN